jgi:thiol-disulfide isomerase/thioredoxin
VAAVCERVSNPRGTPVRILFTATLAAVLVAAALAPAQDKKDPPKKAEPTLKLGDPAPPLKATKWLQGTEVKSFEKGHVYVVEFWATWCGPCIVMMPHMSDLQQEYKGKATFVGFTAKDNRGNNEESVTKFVEKRGPKLKYAFAYADDRDTYEAWMTAAGRGGIPCCFVVDRETKVAFIGHPMYLDVVLPKVVDGTWKTEEAAGIEAIDKEVNALFRTFSGDPEAALKAISDFEAKHPKLAGIPYFNGPRIGAMFKAKKTAEARKFAEQVIEKAVKSDDSGALQSVAATLSEHAAGDKELAALGLRAAEANLKIAGEKDPVALYYVAEAHFASGDKARAREFAARAIAAAPTEGLKKVIEGRTKKYND